MFLGRWPRLPGACLLLIARLLSMLEQCEATSTVQTLFPMDPLGGDPRLLFESAPHFRQPTHVAADLLTGPVPTNDFTDNWITGSEDYDKLAYTQPYAIGRYVKDSPYGIFLSFLTRYSSGTFDDGKRISAYLHAYNELVILSAQELLSDAPGEKPTMEIVKFGFLGISATVRFSKDGAPQYMEVPIVKGQAYLTAIYGNDAHPIVTSRAVMLNVNGESTAFTTEFTGSRFIVETNGMDSWVVWFLDGEVTLTYSGGQLVTKDPYNGVVRTMGIPEASSITGGKPSYANVLASPSFLLLDEHYKVYPTGVDLQISSKGDGKSTITMTWEVEGDTSDQLLLHFTLPHHRANMQQAMATDYVLAGTTKGNCIAYIGQVWQFEETLPFSTSHNSSDPKTYFLPAEPVPTDIRLDVIKYWLEQEMALDNGLTGAAGTSIYWGGKLLYKFAVLCTLADQLMPELRDACLSDVQDSFQKYFDNENGNVLVYDTTWGGIIGQGGLSEANALNDYGNSVYNDHHYHYGYFMSAAAIIGYYDAAWADEHDEWFTTLIRDVANPSQQDEFFPTFRAFDWFDGHSWSHGISWQGSGKDQESTSEEVNFYYGWYLWAKVRGKTDQELLAATMMAVDKRAVQTYFLMLNDSTIHPELFVPNKVTGILFEQKVDYATWFGDDLEDMHGIQVLPVTPFTEEVRTPQFAREEWDLRLYELVPLMNSGWQSVLYMSYAIFQKNKAFEALRNSELDSGLSRTWALYWAATRPDCDTYCLHDEVEHVPVGEQVELCIYKEEDACTHYEDISCTASLTMNLREQGLGMMYDESCGCGGVYCSFGRRYCRLCVIDDAKTDVQLTACPACVKQWYLDNPNVVLSVPVQTPAPTPAPTPWVTWEPVEQSKYIQAPNVMIWSDEFEGNSLDESKWTPMVGDGTDYGLNSGWGNGEEQWYTSEAAKVSGGFLNITAAPTTAYSKGYTSARLRTKGLFEFTYGRLEARIKLPKGKGLWPAFWLLPTDSPYGEGWATSGEMDVLESADLMDTAHSRVHFGYSWPANDNSDRWVPEGTCYGHQVSDFSEDFHVYAMEWEPDEIRMYVDNMIHCSIDFWFSRWELGLYDHPAPFDVPFHLILNLAVGGSYPSYSVDTSALPATMLVDYVRVWQTPEQMSLSSSAPPEAPVSPAPTPKTAAPAAPATPVLPPQPSPPPTPAAPPTPKSPATPTTSPVTTTHTTLTAPTSLPLTTPVTPTSPATPTSPPVPTTSTTPAAPTPSPPTTPIIPTAPPNLPVLRKYRYAGCYRDQEAKRDLAGTEHRDAYMTLETCHDLCKAEGFSIFGLQYYTLCFCGDAYGEYGTATGCEAPCGGDVNEVCGGNYLNSVYCIGGSCPDPEKVVAVAATPAPTLSGGDGDGGGGGGGSGGGEGSTGGGGGGSGGSGGYVYGGCYRDRFVYRDFLISHPFNGILTPTLCYEFCDSLGYSIFGLQYSHQCFCGDSYGRYGTADNCDNECSGDKTVMCGGSYANSVYCVGTTCPPPVEQSTIEPVTVQPTAAPAVVSNDFVYAGCYGDVLGNRDLEHSTRIFGTNTPQVCYEYCLSLDKDYNIFGLQYSFECFCGYSYGQYGYAQNCDKPCAGNSRVLCGGDYANSIYCVGTACPAHEVAGTTTDPTVAVGSYSYVGCFADQDVRDLTSQRKVLQTTLTPNACYEHCKAEGGWKYFGLQYTYECFCSKTYGSYGSSASCDMPCTGNAAITCGGSWANDVYAING